MPLHKSLDINSIGTLKIWRIEESLPNLKQAFNLTENSLQRINAMQSELHCRGFLSVRHLLKEFGYEDNDLFYDAQGKPHLKDGKYISITHSYEYAGVIISHYPVGIDIEKQRSKITRIAQKFTGYEALYLKKSDAFYVNKLTVIWCIKEALYKLFAKPGLSFKKHILTLPFQLSDKNTVAWIDFKNHKLKYNLHFFEFDSFTCAYVIQEPFKT